MAGIKTVTRRVWTARTLAAWQRAWDNGRHIHDGWSKTPCYGGRFLSQFKLTARPYLERLADMPVSDLIAEGGMCQSLPEFRRLIKRTARHKVAVVRFQKIERDEQVQPAPPANA